MLASDITAREMHKQTTNNVAQLFFKKQSDCIYKPSVMQIHYEQALKSYLDERTRRKLWELQAQRHSESEGWRTEWKQPHKTKPFMIWRLILSQMLLTWHNGPTNHTTSHHSCEYLFSALGVILQWTHLCVAFSSLIDHHDLTDWVAMIFKSWWGKVKSAAGWFSFQVVV